MSFLSPLSHRSIIQIKGPDRFTFLQGLVTNDIFKTQDKAIYALLLNPQGRFIFDLFIFSIKDSLFIECERALDLIKRLTFFKLRSHVIIEELKCKVYALWGNGLYFDLGNLRVFDSFTIYSDPRLKDLGARLMVEKEDQTLKEFQSQPFEEYDQFRLSLGIPDGSRDMLIEKDIPLECGMDELHAIDWNKGCYIGQELTVRTKYQGIVRKRLLSVDLKGFCPSVGSSIFLQNQKVGEMRSCVHQKGLALLRLESLKDLESFSLKCENASLSPFIPSWMVL